MEKEGIVDLQVAFSRAGEGRKDLCAGSDPRRTRQAVWSLIRAGAHIYVCGDGSRMEPDVKRALTRIYEADAWIERMGAENRYVLDVWAGG
jgi:cytochrome P450/NADPH-cytochrome P450 reductase